MARSGTIASSRNASSAIRALNAGIKLVAGLRHLCAPFAVETAEHFHTLTAGPIFRVHFTLQGFAKGLDRTLHVRLAAAGPWPRDLVLKRVSARAGRLLDPVGENWAAVGDAAIAFDPLSSQGMLQALHGGLTLGRALCARFSGDASLLDAYRRRIWHLSDRHAAQAHCRLSKRASFPGGAILAAPEEAGLRRLCGAPPGRGQLIRARRSTRFATRRK